MKESKLKRKAVLTVEILEDGRFAIKVNGTLLAECKDDADVDDFITQWEMGAKRFQNGYEIRRTPIPAMRKRRLTRRAPAGKLLRDDALAAESYAIAAIQSLWADHGWDEAQIRLLCDYALTQNYEALNTRQGLPPIREATFNPFNLRRFFE